MAKSQATNSAELSQSIRTTNFKAIMLIKAISKENFNSIQNIIDSIPTKFEKSQILQSTFTQEKLSKDLKPGNNLILDLAIESENTWIITKIKAFFNDAGIAIKTTSNNFALNGGGIKLHDFSNSGGSDHCTTKHFSLTEKVDEVLAGLDSFASHPAA